MFQLIKENVNLAHINTRLENHGEDKVPAVDLKLAFSMHNSRLNDFSLGLQESFYAKPDNQEDLIDAHHMPVLRHHLLPGFSLKYDMAAVRFEIYADGTNDLLLTFSGCKVGKFKFVPKDGGSVLVTFNVSFSGYAKEEYGILGDLLGQDIKINVENFTVQDEDAAGAAADKATADIFGDGVKEQADRAQLETVAEMMRSTEPTAEEQAELDRLDAEAAEVVKKRGAKANLKAIG